MREGCVAGRGERSGAKVFSSAMRAWSRSRADAAEGSSPSDSEARIKSAMDRSGCCRRARQGQHASRCVRTDFAALADSSPSSSKRICSSDGCVFRSSIFSPFGGTPDARERARQRERHRAERNIQYRRDLAIAKSLRPQKQAAAILIRQRMNYGEEALARLTVGELRFRTWRRVDGGHVETIKGFGTAPASLATPQRQVVRDAEEPALQIFPRLSRLQMAKEREEGLLDHLFAVLHRNPDSKRVPQQFAAPLIEERDDLIFEASGFSRIQIDRRVQVRAGWHRIFSLQ